MGLAGVASLVVLQACSGDGDDSSGAGGSSGSGAGTSSGGANPSGGSGGEASGGKSSGGKSSGGEASGTGATASTGGATASGGEGGDGGAETGGSQSGGSAGAGTGGDGGTGGAAPLDPYGPCDDSEGPSDNPACVSGALCDVGQCLPECPANTGTADDCPEAWGGSGMRACRFTLCYLLCSGSEDCPNGMTCTGDTCGW